MGAGVLVGLGVHPSIANTRITFLLGALDGNLLLDIKIRCRCQFPDIYILEVLFHDH